jgi:DNA-binding response OmpR family regulator
MRIMLVEDAPVFAQRLVEKLRAEGFVVEQMNDGEEAAGIDEGDPFVVFSLAGRVVAGPAMILGPEWDED